MNRIINKIPADKISVNSSNLSSLGFSVDQKKREVMQRIDKQISERLASKFTGKLIFIINLSQGGIGRCSVQTDTRLN